MFPKRTHGSDGRVLTTVHQPLLLHVLIVDADQPAGGRADKVQPIRADQHRGALLEVDRLVVNVDRVQLAAVA